MSSGGASIRGGISWVQRYPRFRVDRFSAVTGGPFGASHGSVTNLGND